MRFPWFVCVDDTDLLARHSIVDMSGFPLELVAEKQTQIRLTSYWSRELRHPDLWHDGLWVE